MKAELIYSIKSVEIYYVVFRSPEINNMIRLPAESPNCTRMLLSRSVIKNNSFELASNSGDKEDQGNDFLPNFSSSTRFKTNRKFLLDAFNETEEIDHSKKYSYFNLSSNKDNFDSIKKAKQSQDSKKIIK
jgi:hypothetical protein